MSMIGKILGNFEITSQLGKGGMGEVYQAKDRKLGRDVAIKVLPEEFAKDTDRVARFQREAKLLASLNHPNIAAIHGLEESGGTNFLVLELVQGETLADQIKRGPIPVEESLKLALQIAAALEAAHEKGVIHRDLKPSNITITPDGKVKVLDFGLAKAFAGEQADLNLSNSPTLSNAATQQGVILGTAAYMSPEQARGKSVDKRADIWAFGCVLFEMLTGRQTWTGTTVTDIIAAALAKDPDFGSLPPNIHPDIRKLLSRCLQKDPAERFRDVGDVRVEIKQLLADPGGVLVQPVTAVEQRSKLRTILPWVAAGIVLAAIIATLAVWNLNKSVPRQVSRFSYEPPKDQQFTDSGGIAVSPDGRQFIYSTSKGLYVRSIDELDARLIAGTEDNPQGPFFSPDGKWVGYWSYADKKLKKIAITGGTPIVLCDVGAYFLGASWSADNTIVYSQPAKGIMRISANGGSPESISKPKSGYALAPQILPDGRSMLYTAALTVNAAQMKIMVQSLKSGEPKELFAGVVAQYLPTGHIVYQLANNSLFAIPFNLERLEVKGGPVPIVEGLQDFVISESGTLVYVPGTPRPAAAATGNTLVWVDRDGKEEPLGAPPNNYMFPRISPDGTRVVLAILGDNNDIWIWDLARKTMTRLTFDKSSDIQPIWTPDSKQILFYSGRESKYGGIYRKPADGTGQEEKFASASDRGLYPFCMSSDGKFLVMIESVDNALKWGISMMSMEGDHARKTLLKNDEYNETHPKISPDGRWMAYTSYESGKAEVYVRPFPEVNQGGRWQVSTNGGNSPLWSPSGRELFYFSDADRSVMAVAVETQQTIKLLTPKKLFLGSQYLIGVVTPGTPWDIHPDGKRFLMMKRPEAPLSTEALPRKINIVLNWFEELKQRVPVK
jgi:eukaryotic-like serine/threonine-protein kinase